MIFLVSFLTYIFIYLPLSKRYIGWYCLHGYIFVLTLVYKWGREIRVHEQCESCRRFVAGPGIECTFAHALISKCDCHTDLYLVARYRGGF